MGKGGEEKRAAGHVSGPKRARSEVGKRTLGKCRGWVAGGLWVKERNRAEGSGGGRRTSQAQKIIDEKKRTKWKESGGTPAEPSLKKWKKGHKRAETLKREYQVEAKYKELGGRIFGKRGQDV